MYSTNVRINEQTRSPQFLVLCFFIFILFFSSAPLNFKKQKLKNLKFLAESQSGKLSLSPECQLFALFLDGCDAAMKFTNVAREIEIDNCSVR